MQINHHGLCALLFNFGSAEAQREVPFLGGYQADRWGMKAKPRTVANILFNL